MLEHTFFFSLYSTGCPPSVQDVCASPRGRFTPSVSPLRSVRICARQTVFARDAKNHIIIIIVILLLSEAYAVNRV